MDSKEDSFARPLNFLPFLVSTYTLVFVLGIVFNLVMLKHVRAVNNKETLINKIIVAQGVLGALTSLLCTPLMIVWLLYDVDEYPKSFLKLLRFGRNVSFTAYVQTTNLIAISRYLCVFHPKMIIRFGEGLVTKCIYGELVLAIILSGVRSLMLPSFSEELFSLKMPSHKFYPLTTAYIIMFEVNSFFVGISYYKIYKFIIKSRRTIVPITVVPKKMRIVNMSNLKSNIVCVVISQVAILPLVVGQLIMERLLLNHCLEIYLTTLALQYLAPSIPSILYVLFNSETSKYLFFSKKTINVSKLNPKRRRRIRNVDTSLN